MGIKKMKKLLAAALAACTIIGSFASVSMADHYFLKGKENLGVQTRYNGSYYYDIGFVRAHSNGDKVKVYTELWKNNKWQAGKTTKFSSGTVTCWSGTLQGTGASAVRGRFI